MSASPQFVGQLLGHYRILEQIGAGGMGVVYRAHDEQLDRDVAIKVLPAGILADEDVRKRFRKEALSLAKLNHPNVATVHEFGSQDGIDFLVTEFIAGETLDDKLAGGALPAKQIIDLGLQLAQGLSAAHQQGIVHRDLKPANLRLTPDGRLKILDFGLAQLAPSRDAADLGATVSMVNPHELSGTLPYMSPEQLRGGMTDARTDIWGAGAVLYEMATAHRPFEEKAPTALAGDILHKAPLSPRKLRSEISPRLETIILKCLQKFPANRFQSAKELQADLEKASSTPRMSRHGWLWLAGVTLALLVALAASWNLITRRNNTNISSIPGRRSVAVLGFQNVSGRPDEAWISTALSEMLATELAAGERLRTIPGEDIARTKLDLSLPDTASYGRDTLVRIRKNLDTDYVVLGSYFDTGKESGGQVRLDLWVQDARAGETIAAVSETGSEAELLDLVARTGSDLRRKLGVAEVTAADAEAVRASVPSEPEAAKLYAEGLKKLRTFDALGARDLLQKAVAAEPNYPLAHSALADVWSRLGYDGRAKEEARKAFDLSASLPREERLLVEARYREVNHERDKAIELYRTLFTSFPDNLDYGLRLTTAQWRAGKGKDAMATVDALRKLPPPAGRDPRIDLEEADSAESLGDFKPALAAAARSVERANALGAPLLAAAAQLEQCRIFRNLGQYAEARAACESAQKTYYRAGAREQVANALLATGATLYEQGDLIGSQQAEEQALTVFREVGHESGIAATLSEIANVLSLRGDHLGAKERYEQSLATYREIDDKGNVGAELHNIAAELRLEGNLPEAIAKFHESLAVNRELAQEDVVAMDLANLGSTLLLTGQLDESARTLDQSLEICRRIDFKQACGVALTSQGDLLAWQGRPDEAVAKYAEALAIRNQMGAPIDAAETRVSMAELAIDTGHSADAESAAREVKDVFRKQQLIEDEIWADTVQARASLAQGKFEDAANELDTAAGHEATIQNEEVRLKLALAAAKFHAASGKPADRAAAKNALEAMLAEAKKRGFVGYQLEARFALGELEMKSHQTAAGRAHLTALEKEARTEGFLAVSRKAGALAKT
jgi:serine/threonine protein kinase/tetratricopeptide (TPR) repeat protein